LSLEGGIYWPAQREGSVFTVSKATMPDGDFQMHKKANFHVAGRYYPLPLIVYGTLALMFQSHFNKTEILEILCVATLTT